MYEAGIDQFLCQCSQFAINVYRTFGNIVEEFRSIRMDMYLIKAKKRGC